MRPELARKPDKPVPDGPKCPHCRKPTYRVGAFNTDDGSGSIVACTDGCRKWWHQYKGERKWLPEIPYKRRNTESKD